MATQRPILHLGPGDHGRLSRPRSSPRPSSTNPGNTSARTEGSSSWRRQSEHDLSSEPCVTIWAFTGWPIPNSWNGSSRKAGSAWMSGRTGSATLASSSSGPIKLGTSGTGSRADVRGRQPGRASRERDYVKKRGEYHRSVSANMSSSIGCVVGSRCTLTQQAGYRKTVLHPGGRYAVASFQASRFRSTISSNSLWL